MIICDARQEKKNAFAKETCNFVLHGRRIRKNPLVHRVCAHPVVPPPPFVAGDTLNNPASDGLVEYIRGETEKSLRIKKDDILY